MIPVLLSDKVAVLRILGVLFIIISGFLRSTVGFLRSTVESCCVVVCDFVVDLSPEEKTEEMYLSMMERYNSYIANALFKLLFSDKQANGCLCSETHLAQG